MGSGCHPPLLPTASACTGSDEVIGAAAAALGLIALPDLVWEPSPSLSSGLGKTSVFLVHLIL